MTHGSQEQQQQQSPEVPAEALIKPGDRLPLDEINFQVLGDDNKPKVKEGRQPHQPCCSCRLHRSGRSGYCMIAQWALMHI